MGVQDHEASLSLERLRYPFSLVNSTDSNSPLYLTLPLATYSGEAAAAAVVAARGPLAYSLGPSRKKRVHGRRRVPLDLGECMERPKGKKEKGLPGDSLYIYCNYPRVCPVQSTPSRPSASASKSNLNLEQQVRFALPIRQPPDVLQQDLSKIRVSRGPTLQKRRKIRAAHDEGIRGTRSIVGRSSAGAAAVAASSSSRRFRRRRD